MAAKAQKGVRVLTFGVEKPADVRGGDIRTEGRQTRFTAAFDGETHEFLLPMVGRHNVDNALAAITPSILDAFVGVVAGGIIMAVVEPIKHLVQKFRGNTENAEAH